jgi:hypothetical protein
LKIETSRLNIVIGAVSGVKRKLDKLFGILLVNNPIQSFF